MLSERRADAVVMWAPAKVNLFLEVLAKRPDGYHELATLMVAVSLRDTLEFKEEAGGNIRLECDHPTLSIGPDNLVSRAAGLLRQRLGVERGVSIRLEKRIPLAAGLAGGSADAAATLAGLNLLWGLGLAPTELMALGAELGSDVAFFFATPAAWCTGRGEVVEPLELGKALWFVLACPPVGLSTAEVFRQVTIPEMPLACDAIRQAVREGRIDEIGRRLHNRLQEAAQKLCPAVAVLQRRLESLGPAGHLMSGSGTTVLALCRGRGDALRLAQQLRSGPDDGGSPRVFLVRSCL
jgi:4-diphosphocytidyl-2-C-methyl-D-erythritol kinase